jgi:hypothetical protein
LLRIISEKEARVSTETKVWSFAKWAWSFASREEEIEEQVVVKRAWSFASEEEDNEERVVVKWAWSFASIVEDIEDRRESIRFSRSFRRRNEGGEARNESNRPDKRAMDMFWESTSACQAATSDWNLGGSMAGGVMVWQPASW